MTARCESCNRTRAEMSCHLDVYNDFDGQPGNLICDDCVRAEAPAPYVCVMVDRPEGYYHAPIGTFE